MNIRTLTTICAGLAVLTATVTANLWRALHIERQQIAALQTQLAESDRAHAGVTVPATPRINAGTAVAASASTQAASNATAAKAVPIIQPVIDQRELMKDPEYRRARLAMLRTSIAQSYPGLAEELGLTSEEASRLFDLLAETQMTMTEQLTLIAEPQPDPAAMAEAVRDRQALQRQQEDALRAMLGDAKYKLWQDYQPTRSARMQANTYANTLAQAGAPLDNAQVKSLVAAVSAEQRSMQQDIVALGRTINQSDPQSQQQARAAFTERQAQSGRRTLDAAASQLSAQQLSILRTQIEQQDAIAHATARAYERTQAARSQQ